MAYQNRLEIKNGKYIFRMLFPGCSVPIPDSKINKIKSKSDICRHFALFAVVYSAEGGNVNSHMRLNMITVQTQES